MKDWTKKDWTKEEVIEWLNSNGYAFSEWQISG